MIQGVASETLTFFIGSENVHTNAPEARNVILNSRFNSRGVHHS